jgi:hypothetical protein
VYIKTPTDQISFLIFQSPLISSGAIKHAYSTFEEQNFSRSVILISAPTLSQSIILTVDYGPELR